MPRQESRVREPRGYAGDFEMLARIYENRLCEDPLGRLFDRYFQEEAAPRAVRHRMAMMTEWIVDLVVRSEVVKFAVVGSAFGLEVRDALMRLDESQRKGLSVTLLDLDPSAIEFACESLQGLIGADRLTAISANLFRLPDRSALAAPLDESDLLLCPGLFDYLDDTAAAAMLRTFWERLSPGGRLAVSDVVAQGELPPDLRADLEAWVGCIAGALEEGEYRRLLAAAGFADIEVEVTRVYDPRELAERSAGRWEDTAFGRFEASGGRLVSAFIRASKPVPAEAAACCAPSCWRRCGRSSDSKLGLGR